METERSRWNSTGTEIRAIAGVLGYAREDSNLWPLAPEASALSAELRARTHDRHSGGLRSLLYRVRASRATSSAGSTEPGRRNRPGKARASPPTPPMRRKPGERNCALRLIDVYEKASSCNLAPRFVRDDHGPPPKGSGKHRHWQDAVCHLDNDAGVVGRSALNLTHRAVDDRRGRRLPSSINVRHTTNLGPRVRWSLFGENHLVAGNPPDGGMADSNRRGPSGTMGADGGAPASVACGTGRSRDRPHGLGFRPLWPGCQQEASGR